MDTQNKFDPISMDPVDQIPVNQRFLFITDQKQCYVYDSMHLAQYISQSFDTRCMFTRKPFQKLDMKRLDFQNRIILMTKSVHYPLRALPPQLSKQRNTDLNQVLHLLHCSSKNSESLHNSNHEINTPCSFSVPMISPLWNRMDALRNEETSRRALVEYLNNEILQLIQSYINVCSTCSDEQVCVFFFVVSYLPTVFHRCREMVRANVTICEWDDYIKQWSLYITAFLRSCTNDKTWQQKCTSYMLHALPYIGHVIRVFETKDETCIKQDPIALYFELIWKMVEQDSLRIEPSFIHFFHAARVVSIHTS